MALRWLEGWEGATTLTTHHARLYEVVTGVVGNRRDGASELNGDSISSSSFVARTFPLVASPENTWIIGIAFRSDHSSAINNGAIPYVALRNDDGEQLRLEFVDADPASSKPGGNYYKIRAMRGVTELASTVQRFEINFATDELDWIYFEFKVTIHDTTGSFEGRWQYTRKPSLNSGAPFTLTWDAANTNVDTQNQVTAGANRFELAQTTGNSINNVVCDDIYVCDSTGAKNNNYLGKVIIEGQKIAANGTTIEWAFVDAANTQQAWDEAATAHDDDSRTTSDTPGQIHLGTVDPLVVMIGANQTLVGVRHDIIAHMETSGDQDIAHMFRKTTGSPAQVAAGPDLNVDSTTYEGNSAVLEDDPNTATTWAIADMNSYQYGVRNDG